MNAPIGNTISANQGNGVTLESDTTGIQIVNNMFGFDRFGAPTLPNAGPAIVANDSVAPVISGNVIAVPSVIAVVASPASGILGDGAVVTLTLQLNGVVTVAGGVPALALNNGGSATYVAGSGTNALTFDYTVAPNQDTPDLAVLAVNLNDATVTDHAGNPANLGGAVANPPGILSIEPDAASAFDTTTNQAIPVVGQTYSGPVANITQEYINQSSNSLNISVSTPNWFIHSGAGTDAIAVSSGTNVMGGGGGSSFLSGGSGTDTFFVDPRQSTASTWTTAANFHAGDAATLWGLTPQDFSFAWANGQGANGYTGLTLHATGVGEPTASLTLVGYDQADLNNGKLSVLFGTEPASGSPYMYIAANG